MERWLRYGLLLVLLTLFLSPVMAEGYGLFVAGVEVTSENCNNLRNIPGVTVAPSGEFKYDRASKTLTMKEVTVNALGALDGKSAIKNTSVQDLTIRVSGNSLLNAGSADGLQIEASTTITGNGTLTVKIVTPSAYSPAIYTAAKLTVAEVTLVASGARGILGNGELFVRMATVKGSGWGNAISGLGGFNLESCKLAAGLWWDYGLLCVRDDNGIVGNVTIQPYYGLSIAGVDVTPENCNNLRNIPGVTVAPSGEFKYDYASKTLTMKDVRMDLPKEKIPVCNDDVLGLTISVSGDNKLISTEADCFLLKRSTLITGDGILFAEAVNYGYRAVQCECKVTLTLSDARFTFYGGRAGIWGCAGGEDAARLIVRGATLHAKGKTQVAIQIGSIKLEKCEITSPVGAQWDESNYAVMDGGEKAREVTIDLIFRLNPTTLTEVPAAGGAPRVTLTSDKSWKLTLSPAEATWVTPSVTEGTGSQEVSFTVKKNERFEPRSVTATFTQTGSGKTLTLEVKQAAATPVALLGLSFSPKTAEVEVGKELSLAHTLTFNPTDATNKKVTWSVSEGSDNLELLDQNGRFRGVKIGRATVKVTSEDGQHEDMCTVQVTGFSMTPETLTEVAAAGGAPRVTLTSDKAWKLTLSPAEATWVTPSVREGTGSQEVSFTVKKNERFEPRSVTATFTQTGSGKTLTLEVKQAAATPVALLGLSFSPKTAEVEVGKELSLAHTLTFNPTDATNKKVTWSVSEGSDNLELLDQNGRFRGVKIGRATVKVTSEDGQHEDMCTVSVVQGNAFVESVTITPAALFLSVGATHQLTYSVKSTTAVHPTAIWAVATGSGVVSVDAEGRVKALAVGTAVVTVTVGGKTARCSVTVTAAVPQAVDDALLANVRIAPNPFTTHLRIMSFEETAVAYELVNLEGIVLRAGVLEGTETAVDTEDLAAGVYIVHLRGASRASRAVRVVKY